MNLVTQVFAMVAVAFGVVAFVLESFLFHRPSVQTFLLGKPEPAAGVRLWAFADYAGHEEVGRALVIYGCAFMAACGVVLFISDRRLWRSMIGQSGPPLIALIAALA
jgi:putative membrane protein